MIAVDGSRVVHLGGQYGDRLHAGGADEGLRPLADLGWDDGTQATPQRRFLIAGDTVLVLEPVRGPVLAPPLRVRRFDWNGRELERVEGDGDEGPASLYFHHSPDGTLVRYGIDAASGRPTAWRGRLDLDRRSRKLKPLSGTPLRHGDAWYYAVRMEGVWRISGDEVTIWRGEPGLAQEIRGAPAWPGMDRRRPGVWLDGAFVRLSGGRLFPKWTPPLLPWVAPVGDGGLVVLRRNGGRLPAVDPVAARDLPPGRLPAGLYSSLVDLPEGLFAVAEGAAPRLVPVTF